MSLFTDNSAKNTLAYFGLFDHPLTSEELYNFLWRPPAALGYTEFLSSLPNGEKTAVKEFPSPVTARGNFISEKYGFYFFSGCEAAVEIRRERAVYSDLKMRIAGRAVKKIRSVPFLRAIFVCNSVATGRATKDSDIDLFIVTAPGRVWLVRFFCNFILRLWGLRTYGVRLRDRVCLSFFVDENSMNLEKLQATEADVHFIYWLHQMVPLYDPAGLFRVFFVDNDWTKKYLPNIKERFVGGYANQVKDSPAGKIWKRFWEKMWSGAYGNLVEKQSRALQRQMMPLPVKEKAGKNTDVVISDSVIKLHGNDNRLEIKARWETVRAADIAGP